MAGVLLHSLVAVRCDVLLTFLHSVRFSFIHFIFSLQHSSHFVARSRLCTLRGCVTRWHNGDENVFDLDSRSYFFFIRLLFRFVFRASWTHHRQLHHFQIFRLEMRCDNSQSVWQRECILKMINACDKIIYAGKNERNESSTHWIKCGSYPVLSRSIYGGISFLFAKNFQFD